MEFKPEIDPSHATTLVVVLGMHRSGTSVVTRAMETMGAEFGDNLMPAVPGVNDKGFFEDLDIYAINQEILALAGADWHSLAPIEFDKIDEASLQRVRERASQLLAKKCENKTFALKDPRISRLLPFWKPVFDSLGIRVVYALAVRNPMSVGRSLEKRDHFPSEKSYLLWLLHTIPPLGATKGAQRVLVNYDKLMENPRAELARMSTQLELPLDASRAQAFERDFLDGGLRHTRFASRDLSNANAIERHVNALFSVLESETEIDESAFEQRVQPVVEQAQAYLDDIAPVLRLEWKHEKELAVSRGEIAAQQQRIEALASEAGDWRARTESAVAAEASAVAAEAHLRAEFVIANDAQRILAESVESRDRVIAAQDVALQRAERTVHDMLGSKSWYVTKPLRFLVRLASGRK
ncbi:sulfotransferase family protein [Burkholderia anthina]|uniref:sulfotransferase family protein n=1 Tax=Burkholderia anthina TaxID=179879 RepID=UPI0037BF7F12